jgi:glutathione synthase/RimK-type ligase-like ATP-grasp enzyme
MLLIISNSRDIACDYLILKLNERGVPFERFNTDDFPDLVTFDISILDGKIDFELSLRNDIILKSNKISSVYFRQPLPPDVKIEFSEAEKSFVDSELTEFLRSFWRTIPEELWLNHPKMLWMASSKVEQLNRAMSIGFNIPDTLISSQKEKIEEFLKRKKKVICKAIRHGFVKDKNKVMLAGTKRVPDNFIDRFDDWYSLPMIYQEELIKGIDIRAVVVGEKVFAANIIADQSDDGNIDWRVSQIEGKHINHQAADLPNGIKQKCVQIVKSFGLRYSSIDLIRDIKGKYYFLELNPNGQWAWIEQLTGHAIRDSIIDEPT